LTTCLRDKSSPEQPDDFADARLESHQTDGWRRKGKKKRKKKQAKAKALGNLLNLFQIFEI